ncbi:MAG: SBBP repeat-containing protein [Chloroflexota bacterium]
MLSDDTEGQSVRVQSLLRLCATVAVAAALLAPGPRAFTAGYNVDIAYGVAVDPRGNIYVSDSGHSRIVRLSPRGAPLARWSTLRTFGPFSGPGAIAADRSGQVYVVDVGNVAIVTLSATGHVLARWGSYGHRAGQFSAPAGLAGDNRGNLYVADSGNNRIEKMSRTGKVVAVWDNSKDFSRANFIGFERPEAISIDRDGYAYVADTSHDRIVKLSPQGQILAAWGKHGSGIGEFMHPEGLAVDGRGDLFVADTMNRRVVTLTTSGVVRAVWSRQTPARMPIDYPQRMVVDRQGNLYVVGLSAEKVAKLSPSGRLLALWHVWGSKT